MRAAFDKEEPPLLLSVSLSGYPEILKQAYDIPAMSKAVDFFTVMTYDYHGAWEGMTGHVAPLKPHPPEKYAHYNVVSMTIMLISSMINIIYYIKHSHGFVKVPNTVGRFYNASEIELIGMEVINWKKLFFVF